ncbi:MAG: HAMP domain-containing histidine kinase [Leptolyngbya sp.]|nr:HAMP domain-containing histidine kinase [Candidatus Melainabacteria bacterium]
MSQENTLRTNLALSEEALSRRTNERDKFELAFIESEHELSAVHLEFTEATRQHAANMASLALKLSQVSTQLEEKKAENKADAAKRLVIEHERACFEKVLHDLKIPLIGGTKILEYLAAEKVDQKKQAELLNQIIDANKRMITGADHLSAESLTLTQRTAQLDESNKGLTERAVDLEHANAELKAIMQQREAFVVSLTHDLKNPLIGGTRILEFIVDGSIDSDRQPAVLRQVINSNKCMLRMIWNMLDVYRYEAGALIPFQESVNFGELIKHCLEEFAFAIREKEVEVIFEVPDNLIIKTDRIMLRRVLTNLLDNAVKFSPQGGQLFVQATCNQQQLGIVIKDCGPGMKETQLGKVFERFWQTRHGREASTGTGLGLFLSKQIIETLGGQIECTSIENGGTTFTISLPHDVKNSE